MDDTLTCLYSQKVTYMYLLIIFLSISLVQTIDYDINNEQICTHPPFQADFHHNCSRTRLTDNITIPNTDEILYLSIIFTPRTFMNRTITIRKSSIYNPKSNLTFIIFIINTKQSIYGYIHQKILLPSNDSMINFDFNDELSKPSIEIIDSSSDLQSTEEFYCALKDTTNFPLPLDTTRLYYLYTNETTLNLDFTVSNARISPLLNRFQTCYHNKTSLTTLAIILIVLVCVLSSITLILLAICLKKQLTVLYYIMINCQKKQNDQVPQVIVH